MKTFPRPSRGFTLIELLVVLAIAAVLMALALSSIGRLKERANTAVSLSNLRQIGVAMNLYAGENGNYFPPGWDGSQTYANHLDVYLSTDLKNAKNIFISPNSKIPVVAGYYGITYSAHGLLCDDITDGDDRPPRAAVRSPSQLILVADGTQNPSNFGQAYAHFWNPPELYLRNSTLDRNAPIPAPDYADQDLSWTGGWMRYRNNGAVNVLMVDGHTESIRKGEVLFDHVLVD